MNVLRFIYQVIVALVRATTSGAVLGLIEIARRFRDAIKAWLERKRLPHPFKNAADKCVTVRHTSFHRPDPCIYSQSYLMKLGLPVTWDNPDIILLRNGLPVPENEILPATQYEIEATIWNNSYDAPVVGMPVEFSFLSFGVATTSTAIGTTLVSVGVKGSTSHPARTRIAWLTPPTPGHYCIQAKLVWVDDVNPENNLGQNNVDVALAQSPAHFDFTLRNGFAREQRFTFTVDVYTPLALPECPATPSPQELRTARIRRMVELHKSRDFSVPAGWTVAIQPDAVALAPGQEVTVQVDVTPPAGFAGEQPFNVNAFADGKFAGGVTLIARTP
jgi:hypothetical protein